MSKVLIFVLLIMAVSAKGEDMHPKAGEIRMLPSYCQQKHPNFKTLEGDKKWKKTFGELWSHMHHYCMGINFKNRAAKGEKKSNLVNAVNNLHYTLHRTPKDHFYRPQILLEMAKVKKMQKKYDEAVVLDKEAISLKDDFIPAYLDLSRLYRKLGDNKKAKEVIELGLKYKPDSKILKKKLKKLSK